MIAKDNTEISQIVTTASSSRRTRNVIIGARGEKGRPGAPPLDPGRGREAPAPRSFVRVPGGGRLPPSRDPKMEWDPRAPRPLAGVQGAAPPGLPFLPSRLEEPRFRVRAAGCAAVLGDAGAAGDVAEAPAGEAHAHQGR